MPRKWIVLVMAALVPVLALVPLGCVLPGDVGVALLVSPATLNFGTTSNQQSFQVSKVFSTNQLQPVVAVPSAPWIVVEDCNDAADQCLSNGPGQQKAIRVSVLRDRMNFGTNRGQVILQSGGASVKTVDVVAEDTLQATFSADRRRPEAGQPVQFTDLSLSVDDIVSRSWDFGDGSTSTEINPAHIYEKDGTYSVSLTVSTASTQETATLTAYITVATAAADVDFSADRTIIDVNQVVFFTNLTVSPTEPVLTNFWDFGDGGTSPEASPNHQFRVAGPKTVSLTVTTAQGSVTKTKTNFILVQNKLGPTARIAISQLTPYVDIAVQFNDVSDAGTSPILNRVWEFGDGTSSIEQNPSHVYRIAGHYTVKLTVITEHGTSLASMDLDVTYKPPHADFVVTLDLGSPPDTTANNPDTFQNVNFLDRSEAGSGPVSFWSWSFGDGKTDTVRNPVHRYTVAGNYTVALTVRTPSPANNEDTVTKKDFIVVVAPPVPSFRYTPRSIYIDQTVQFQDTTTKGSEAIASYSWDFDGSDATSTDQSTSQNPTFVFKTPGINNTTLTIKTATRTRTSIQKVIVDKAPVADFTAAPRTATTVDAIVFTDATKPGIDGASLTKVDDGGDKSIIARQWNFGDGGASSATNPTHTYAASGVYNVILIVTYAHSGTGQTFQTTKEKDAFITINNPKPPTANFEVVDSCLFTNSQVTFHDTSLAGSRPATSWSWNFGDGTALDPRQNPTHVFSHQGEFNVTLTVKSNQLPQGFNTASITKPIYITNVQDLDDFVNTPDPAYHYNFVNSFPVLFNSTQIATAYNLYMVSQTWRTPSDIYTGNYDGTIWNHSVTIIQPNNLTSNGTGLILLNGGSRFDGPPSESDIEDSSLGLISAVMGSTLTLVSDIPAEPIEFKDEVVGGVARSRSEDEILAYSFDKYLDSFNAGVPDKTWPVLFPMTKAAVRAMDTVQDYMAAAGTPVDNFIVTGGSKRGWTTWLTGINDCRVKAMAPIVADLLNTSVTVSRQIPVYGAFAETLTPYNELGIFEHFVPNAGGQLPADGASLLSLIDPFSYRERARIPKLLINSTGDQFFLPDSSLYYFDQLKGENHISYLPNTSHYLTEIAPNLRDPGNVASVLASWSMGIMQDIPRPNVTWTFPDANSIDVQLPTPLIAGTKVLLWKAVNSQARDFRFDGPTGIGSAFRSTVLTGDENGLYHAVVTPPTSNTAYLAFLVQVQIPSTAVPAINIVGAPKPYFVFSTPLRVTPDTYPFASP